MGGGALGQRGDLLLRARRPQAAQQPGLGGWAVEADVGYGPAQEADVIAQVVRRIAEVENSVEGSAGGGLL